MASSPWARFATQIAALALRLTAKLQHGQPRNDVLLLAVAPAHKTHDLRLLVLTLLI
jgi:hypothetical protein